MWKTFIKRPLNIFTIKKYSPNTNKKKKIRPFFLFKTVKEKKLRYTAKTVKRSKT